MSLMLSGDEVLTDLMIDPRSKSLVLNGKPGHLQFYSLLRDKHLYNVRLLPSIQFRFFLKPFVKNAYQSKDIEKYRLERA